ncbi:IS110 family transposase [Arthrobacter alpinus]|uniref:IS110 family transposase n=1 Tax=Arthrobacter alpinus TaxID=656366 RepID=UPI0016475FDF|nr:IS110 family transposase [Arthrobacter alpinus]
MQEQNNALVPIKAVAGIDAAVTAVHHIAVREIYADGTEQLTRFTAAPTLAGLAALSRRLAAVPIPVHAVVEPTSMTWLALTLAVERAGGQMAMVGARHSARLRGAIMGKNKSDLIDSEVLTHAGEIFDPPTLALPSPVQLALRRAVVRRHGAVIDANRTWRRLMSLSRWAFPDVWIAFAGSEATALAVLERWPDLRSLASAREGTLTAVVAAHTRDVADTPARAAAIKSAAKGWAQFWEGHLELDGLAVDVSEHLHDLREARERVDRFTAHSSHWWEQLWGDDPLVLSLPGVGPATGPCIRAYFGDGSGFENAKKAANYVGITPSNWSSGTMHQTRRAISKEGPAPLRLAFYQSASVARSMDPQLAAFYHRLMTESGHCHTQAVIAVARKLAERTWKTLTTGEPYQLRDLEGKPITRRAAKELITSKYTVSTVQRAKARSHTTEAKRARLTR